MAAVRVRFAPSPTGPLHIGGARSALFNWLFARRNGGIFIVRVEDTDLERSSRQSEENILGALRWLGLDWDEGIKAGGPHGPYRQTERLEFYSQYAGLLLEQGNAYHCYCTEEELAAQREALMARGEMPRYLGRCRSLTPEDRAHLDAQGRKPSLRFKVPGDGAILVKDLVRGDVSFDCSGIGDFIIMKSDGIPTYNYAVVVDDHLMAISHVIRAEEHLSNTPRQILLFEALGWDVPQFAHVSLILGNDRSKMSKRHGATAIEQYQEKGYLPEALVNFMALLGWSPGTEEEILSPVELKQQFSLERVAKSPAVFDLDKLNWLNGHYIRNASLDRITDLAVPYLEKAGYLKALLSDDSFAWIALADVEDLDSYKEVKELMLKNKLANFAGLARSYLMKDKAINGEALEDLLIKKFLWLKIVVASVRQYLRFMEEITGHVRIYFNDDVKVEEEAREVMAGGQVLAALSTVKEKVASGGALNGASTKAVLKEAGKELGIKGKQIFVPVRVALTGSIHGPDLNQIMVILGKDGVVRRLAKWEMGEENSVF